MFNNKERAQSKKEEKARETSFKKKTFLANMKDLHLSVCDKIGELNKYKSVPDNYQETLKHLSELKSVLNRELDKCNRFFSSEAQKSKGPKTKLHLNSIAKTVNDLQGEILMTLKVDKENGTNLYAKLHKKIMSRIDDLEKKLSKTSKANFKDNSRLGGDDVKKELNRLIRELKTTSECIDSYSPSKK